MSSEQNKAGPTPLSSQCDRSSLTINLAQGHSNNVAQIADRQTSTQTLIEASKALTSLKSLLQESSF